MSSTDTYFVAATTVTPGPTSAWTRSYAARIRSGSTDELFRPRQLRLSPVQLAVQLQPAELGQHLAHPGRLREAELGEVAPGDLERHAAQVGEVPAQGGELRKR